MVDAIQDDRRHTLETGSPRYHPRARLGEYCPARVAHDSKRGCGGEQRGGGSQSDGRHRPDHHLAGWRCGAGPAKVRRACMDTDLLRERTWRLLSRTSLLAPSVEVVEEEIAPRAVGKVIYAGCPLRNNCGEPTRCDSVIETVALVCALKALVPSTGRIIDWTQEAL